MDAGSCSSNRRAIASAMARSSAAAHARAFDIMFSSSMVLHLALNSTRQSGSEVVMVLVGRAG